MSVHLRRRDGHLYIVDEEAEAAWREEVRSEREKAIALWAVFVIGGLLLAVFVGILL